MATLDTTRSYNDGEVLVESDLDAFLDDIETFLNVTKINDDNIQNNGITGSTKLLNQSVTEAKLAANAVTTLKVADGAVTAAKLGTDAVTTVKIQDDAVTEAKIADSAVSTDRLAASAVTTAKIADDAVTADKLKDSAATDADRAVTTDHIRDSAVTTAKVNDGAITPGKCSTNYYTATLTETIVSRTNAGTSSGTVDIGTMTQYGRPVMIMISDGTAQTDHGTGGGTITSTIIIERVLAGTPTTVATILSTTADETVSYTGAAGSTYFRLDPSGATGSVTYRLKATITLTLDASTASDISVTGLKVTIYEL